jgi:uncharacterized protein YqjF (DUF2071 family)
MTDPVAAVVSRSRGWPAPRRPWLLRMVWEDLLFAHWPCDTAVLEPHLPPGLALDTFDGRAWLGIVPFRISGIRARCLPAIPGLTGVPELNLRTYVVADGKPGVWFFSLDAASRAAVRCARRFYHLPYHDARITCSTMPDGWIDYQCRRRDSHQHPPAEFSARYRPLGGADAVTEDPLATWLTARYCLYSADRRRRVWRGEIDHVPWPLETADAVLETNTLAAALNCHLSASKPVLHFSRRLEAVIWSLERVRVD